MIEKTRSITVRLLRDGKQPEDAVREGVILRPWPAFEGAKIVTGHVGGNPPSWTDLLALKDEERASLYQRFAYGLVFLHVENRWFAIAFGLGHSKLDPAVIEQDFGLKVVLNSVDHTKLKSADIRTPDSNTVSRRSQASRSSEHTIFDIDPERDIVRGLHGEPKDKLFASKVSGADALTVRRKVMLEDLPKICSESLKLYFAEDYKKEFGWIDHIRHVREVDQIAKLDEELAKALTNALSAGLGRVDDIALAYPSIYDPEKLGWVRFRGFGLREIFPDLEIEHYLSGLKKRGLTDITPDCLRAHTIQECDDTGQIIGNSWPIHESLVFEAQLDEANYVLSGGRWYRIADDLAKEVQAFFDQAEKVELPEANAGENEERYNERLSASKEEMLCLDRKLVKPSGASSSIEVCDFLGRDRRFVHVKDKTASSRLSHLFNQGLVSAVTFKRDSVFRAEFRKLIEGQLGRADYAALIPAEGAEWSPGDFKVVFGVLANTTHGKEPKLPFFSLIAFRQAARHIKDELGYKLAFSWIRKAGAGEGVKPKKQNQ